MHRQRVNCQTDTPHIIFTAINTYYSSASDRLVARAIYRRLWWSLSSLVTFEKSVRFILYFFHHDQAVPKILSVCRNPTDPLLKRPTRTFLSLSYTKTFIFDENDRLPDRSLKKFRFKNFYGPYFPEKAFFRYRRRSLLAVLHCIVQPTHQSLPRASPCYLATVNTLHDLYLSALTIYVQRHRRFPGRCIVLHSDALSVSFHSTTHEAAGAQRIIHLMTDPRRRLRAGKKQDLIGRVQE